MDDRADDPASEQQGGVVSSGSSSSATVSVDLRPAHGIRGKHRPAGARGHLRAPRRPHAARHHRAHGAPSLPDRPGRRCPCLRELEPETLAKDNVTPPYLVFEWWVVEAFVRASDELAESGRIPGIQKVQACYHNSRPVSAPAYLKTASVFGFTGIFRRLARHTQILTNDGLLDEAGYRLLEVWEREQGLEGFLRGREGPGATLRDNLRKAVRDGLDTGHTSHRPGHFWSAIARHLDPARPGRRERAVLLELIDTRAGQSEAVKFITASLRARGAPLEFADEAAHLRSLRSSAPDSLRPVLIAIDKYESLCRPLTDAFDWMRFLASQEPSRGMTAEDFLARAPAARLCTRIAKAVESVSENELVAETWPERAQVLTLLREAGTPAKLVPTVLAAPSRNPGPQATGRQASVARRGHPRTASGPSLLSPGRQTGADFRLPARVPAADAVAVPQGPGGVALMGRRSKSLDPESCRLLNLWSPDADFGAPIGCVATTFTFDAGHFEEQCLARFISMETDPGESARAYLIEREEKLSQVFACILVDQRHAQNQRSLRWHLLPIRLPGLAIQHAKLSLLLWERHLRIVIGSANLTAAGYRTNRELVAALDFAPEHGGPLALARGCIDYLRGPEPILAGQRQHRRTARCTGDVPHGRPAPDRALVRFVSQGG